MLRAVLRLIVVIVILVVIGAFFVGYRWGGPARTASERPAEVTGTTGTGERARGIDEARARQAGAEVGQKVAEGVNEAQHAVAEASLTTKIKSKMALDDLVQARNINVDTNGSVVTVSGVVHSEAEHERAVQLARETAGITSVVDHLEVRSAQ